MKNLTLLLATIGGTLLLIVGVALLFSKQNAVSNLPADEQKVVGERGREQIASGSSNLEATTAAQPQKKVVLAVFSDFQCPACGSLERSFLIAARQTYAGQVEFVYRHFPLDGLHAYARMAAWASEAAKDENSFWEYHDLLYKHQTEWSSLRSKEAVRTRMIEYALQLGIDKDKFIARMDSDDIKKRVEADVTDGNALGVNATPTVYLNNNKTAPQDLADQIKLLLNI